MFRSDSFRIKQGSKKRRLKGYTVKPALKGTSIKQMAVYKRKSHFSLNLKVVSATQLLSKKLNINFSPSCILIKVVYQLNL